MATVESCDLAALGGMLDLCDIEVSPGESPLPITDGWEASTLIGGKHLRNTPMAAAGTPEGSVQQKQSSSPQPQCPRGKKLHTMAAAGKQAPYTPTLEEPVQQHRSPLQHLTATGPELEVARTMAGLAEVTTSATAVIRISSCFVCQQILCSPPKF